MSNLNSRTVLAVAATLGELASRIPGGRILSDIEPERPTLAQTARWRAQRGYPQTGTGKRQGERVARLVRRALGDPFAASNRCIERIKARLASGAQRTVLQHGEKK
jgi:hypothetical protein